MLVDYIKENKRKFRPDSSLKLIDQIIQVLSIYTCPCFVIKPFLVLTGCVVIVIPNLFRDL